MRTAVCALLPALLLAGCGDDSFSYINSPPTAQIISPTTGTKFSRGAPVRLEAIVGDVDQPFERLHVKWVSDKDGTLVELNPDAEGNTAYETSSLSNAIHTLTLQVSDDRNATTSVGVQILVNTPPTASITAPAADARFDSGATVTLVGNVADEEDDASTLSASWASDQDGVLGSSTPDGAGTVSLQASRLSPGAHEVTLNVEDSGDFTASASIRFLINTLPEVEILGSEPSGTLFSDEPIELQAEVSDVEDAPTELVSTWESDLDGTLGSPKANSSGELSLVLPGADGDGNGQSLSPGTHHLTLTVEDTLEGVAVDTYTLVVDPPNGAPSPPEIHLEPAEPSPEDDLTVIFDKPAVDPEGQTVTYAYTWRKAPDKDGDGVADSPATLISEVTGQTVAEAYTGPGELWSVEVVAADPYDAAAPVSARVAIAPNLPPSIPKVHIEPADPGPDDALELILDTPSTDPEGRPVTYVYSWYRASDEDGDGEPEGAPTLVSELTGQTVPAELTDPGDRWEARVVASDPYEPADAASAFASIRIPLPPTTPEIRLSPDQPTTVQDLTLAITRESEDLNPEDFEVSYDIVWKVNGAPITELEGALLVDADRTRRDDEWTVEVTARTVYAEAEAVTASVTVIDTAPTLQKVVLSPDSGNETTVFSAVPQGYDDVDGDAAQYSYEWLVNSALVSKTATLDGSSFDKGDTVACRVTPSDGMLSGAPVTSAAVKVANSPPTLEALTLGPEPAWEDTVLEAEASGYADADSEDQGKDLYHYRWYVNDVLVNGASAATLDGTFFSHFDTVWVEAAAWDGESEGPALTSSPIDVLNTPPEAASASIQPQTPGSSDTLRCEPGGYFDLDADAPGTHVYAWTINGSPTSDTGATLAPGRFKRGDLVSCRITPFDGYDYGSPVSSPTVQIANGVPSAPGVTLTPDQPRVYHALICSVTTASVDPDGDPVTYTFAWYAGDVLRPEFTTDTLPEDTAQSEETWTCRVTAVDSLGAAGAPGEASVTFLPVLSIHTVAAFTGETQLDNAGYSVAALGDTNGDQIPDFAIGAPSYDVQGTPVLTDGGRVYYIFGKSTGWASSSSLSQADASYNATTAGELAGQTLAGGDFDGDGLGDLAIAAPSYDVSSSSKDNGRLFFILGHETGWKRGLSLTTANQIVKGNSASDRMGNPMAALGDINGDGLDDLAVGTYATGEVYLLFGRTTGWKGETTISALATASLVVETSSDKGGLAIGRAGDVNGDGLDDLLIGAPNAAGGYGVIYLVMGKQTGWALKQSLSTATYRFQGEAKADLAGGGNVGGVIGLQPLAGGFDVDGDGLSDILIGASGNDSAASNAGKAYLFRASSRKDWNSATTLADADGSFLGEQFNCGAGQTIAGLDDLDGDGFGEFLLGAPASDVGATNAGSVTLWAGSDEGFQPGLSWSFASLPALYGEEGEFFGAALASVGDVTADGRDEFVITAPQSDLAGVPSGTVYLMSGP